MREVNLMNSCSMKKYIGNSVLKLSSLQKEIRIQNFSMLMPQPKRRQIILIFYCLIMANELKIRMLCVMRSRIILRLSFVANLAVLHLACLR